VEIRRSLDLKYSGQAYELTIPVATEEPVIDDLVAAFHAEHEKTYGHAAEDSPIDLVNVRVVARTLGTGRATLAEILNGDVRADVSPTRRTIRFGADEPVETRVVGRGSLGGGPTKGPLVIEEYDATTVVPPGWAVKLDHYGNLELSM
jgi:N-methylhydantoinase A